MPHANARSLTQNTTALFGTQAVSLIVPVDIVAACFNGAEYLPEFLASLQSQTHATWRLWARDDGSTDATVDILRTFAASEPRIRLLHVGGPPLGAAGAFGWLLNRVPPDSLYIMFADQDDVWLPDKISRTLAAMRAAEAVAPGPILVHTDLVVVDAELREIHPSLWRFSRVDPEPVTFRRLIVQNVVTGAATMLNQALRVRAGSLPAGAFYHDWWYACVAAAFGRVVAVRDATILYRQHGANALGAKRRTGVRWYEWPGAVWRALEETAHLRAQFANSAAQADALLEHYGAELSEEDRRFLRAFARIPHHRMLRRKLEVIRMHLRREDGLLRNLGVLLRA